MNTLTQNELGTKKHLVPILGFWVSANIETQEPLVLAFQSWIILQLKQKYIKTLTHNELEVKNIVPLLGFWDFATIETQETLVLTFQSLENLQQRQTHWHNELDIENIVFIFQFWVFANIETQETLVLFFPPAIIQNNPSMK
jgi:hypothetical protein